MLVGRKHMHSSIPPSLTSSLPKLACAINLYGSGNRYHWYPNVADLCRLVKKYLHSVKTRKWFAHTAVGKRLIYSPKINGAFQHLKFGGFLRIKGTQE
jgi:hypothetical protein